MNYQEYVKSELLILIPVLYFIGIGIKKSKLPDKWIPLSLGAMSVFLTVLWVFADSDIGTVKAFASALFTAVTQGILIAGTSVYVNQLYVQSNKSEKRKDGENDVICNEDKQA